MVVLLPVVVGPPVVVGVRFDLGRGAVDGVLAPGSVLRRADVAVPFLVAHPVAERAARVAVDERVEARRVVGPPPLEPAGGVDGGVEQGAGPAVVHG